MCTKIKNEPCMVNMKTIIGGEVRIIKVDFNKLPCSKCERYGHFCCPKSDCWNKEGKYCLY